MSKKFTVLVGLLMAVAVTGYSVSGTYAKYTEDFSAAQTSANVAKWEIKFLDDKDAETDTFSFDLFANATNGSLKSTVNGADQAVKTIAPGSTGSFTIKLRNNSDVNAEYTAEFTVGGANVPLQFKVSGVDADWTDDLSNITTAVAMTEGSDAEITVEWQWPYEKGADATEKETNNEADTTLGKDHGTVTVDATVTVSQVAA